MNELALDKFSKDIIREKKDIKVAVDMTCGNGNDTLFLSGIADEVYGFDVQFEAVDATRKLIEENNKDNVCLFCTSFENIAMYLKEADVFMYNLGYLPGGDKSVVTTTEATLDSLNKALYLLNSGGLVSIMAYPGHEEGAKELKALDAYLADLNNKAFEVLKFDMINKNDPPVLFIIKKK